MATMLMSLTKAKPKCHVFSVSSRNGPSFVSRAIVATISNHTSYHLNDKDKRDVKRVPVAEKTHLGTERKGRDKDRGNDLNRSRGKTLKPRARPTRNLIKSHGENENNSQKNVDETRKKVLINYKPGTLFKYEKSGLFDWVAKIDTESESSDSQFISIHERKWKDELEELIPQPLPQNAFEEMMLYQDKIWNFPIDNEDDKEEEENIGFEEHVFLDYLLDEFPDNESIRKFMELVVTGLQQNPYLTVDEKKRNILWFKDYFAQFPEEDLQVKIS